MMADLTASGVCYDLPSSPYTCEYGGMRYHFSTYAHMRNFMSKVREQAPWLDDSFTRRFRYDVSTGQLGPLNLYRKIETRGFYVEDLDSGSVYRHVTDIEFRVVMDHAVQLDSPEASEASQRGQVL